METLGWIFISTGAALMIMLGLYGLARRFAGAGQASSLGRLRIRIDRRLGNPAGLSPSSPIGSGDHPGPISAPLAVPPDRRSVDELFSEIFALRESVAEMSNLPRKSRASEIESAVNSGRLNDSGAL